MRVYLDTNILAFIVGHDGRDSISNDVEMIINDYGTRLLTSSMCILELIHLIQIGKVHIDGQKDVRKAAAAALGKLEELGIKPVPSSNNHYKVLIDLPLFDDHRDPADRLIISQAIADHIPLISSDHKFSRYERYGLDFIFNQR